MNPAAEHRRLITVRELDALLKEAADGSLPRRRHLLGRDEGFTDRLKKTYRERDPSDTQGVFKVATIGDGARACLIAGSHHLDALLEVDKLDTPISVEFVRAADYAQALVLAAAAEHQLQHELRALSLADTLTFVLEHVSIQHSRRVPSKGILKKLRAIMSGWGWDKTKCGLWAGDGELSIAGGLLLEGRMAENAEAAREIIAILRKAKVSGTRRRGVRACVLVSSTGPALRRWIGRRRSSSGTPSWRRPCWFARANTTASSRSGRSR